MKTLVLITSQFPFGTGESFLEAEFPLLINNFERVLIIAQNVSLKQTRNIKDNAVIYRYNPSSSIRGFLYSPILVFLNFGRIKNLVKEEVKFRRSINDPLTIKKKLYLYKKIIKALQLRDFIKKSLYKEKITKNIVFYSYWLKTSAHAIAMIDCPKCLKISRAHGSDIYEETNRSEYLPLLKFSTEKLDAIFFISENGKRYLMNKTNTDGTRFIVSRLGVEKPYYGNLKINQSDKFIIVSCSNMVPLKRIDLIIYSLELVMTNKEIQWLHFGDGVLRNELEALASQKLGLHRTISYTFMGHYPNQNLLEYYSQNRIDLFINVSSTEGIPVSIMEAQAFGIPVIATDVGGVSELVTEGTGTLLTRDFRTEDLAERIQYYVNLPGKEVEKIRKKAFNNWELNFNSQLNYRDFIIKLNTIFASVQDSIQ
jgi:glycosyltransferase involved in cell wall biosynthesis